jgi:DNA-binding transcriptional MerR regulator
MQDLEFPFLTPQIVSGLTGLTPQALRRLRTHGIPAGSRSAPGKPPRGRRLYSWQEVEQLQQATFLLKTKRLSLGEVKRFLQRSQAAALDRDWVIARPKPRGRRRRFSVGAGRAQGGPAGQAR